MLSKGSISISVVFNKFVNAVGRCRELLHWGQPLRGTLWPKSLIH